MGKELCVSNTWLERQGRIKVTVRYGVDETEMDFFLIRIDQLRFLRNVMAIPWKFEQLWCTRGSRYR